MKGFGKLILCLNKRPEFETLGNCGRMHGERRDGVYMEGFKNENFDFMLLSDWERSLGINYNMVQ